MMDAATKEIGTRVRERREKLGLTREKLAELAGLSVQFTASIELGKQRMTTDSLARICRALHVSSDYIVFGEEMQEDPHDLNAMTAPLGKEAREQAEQVLAIIVDMATKRK